MKTTKLLKLSPSAAEVWSRCGGSVLLKGAADFTADKTAADRGTLIHKIAEATLKSGHEIDTNTLNAFEKQLYEAEKDTIDSFILTYTETIYADTKKPIVEKYMQTEFPGGIIGGTPDAFTVNKNQITVYDLKTGHIEVDAEQNAQLLVYAHLIAKTKKVKNPQLTGVIVQPELKQVARSEYVYDPDFFDRITIDTKQFNTGAHCVKCGVRSACAAFNRRAQFFLQPEFRDYTLAREQVWTELLDIAPAAIKFFEEVKSEALRYLQAGGTIPGYTLGKRKNNRSWLADVTPEALAATFKGLDPAQLYKIKFESPSGVEKILKAAGIKANLDEYTFSSESFVLKKDGKSGAFEKLIE